MHNAFGVHLQSMIDARRVNKSWLHLSTGISRTAIDSHLEGKSIPTRSVRDRYARAFGITTEEFDSGWISADAPTDPAPNNFDPRPMALPPEWEIDVSATVWVPVPVAQLEAQENSLQ